ncbi:DUF1345 domain-containing protein [Caulobacter segnis]|uniref:DUF1345 domain-containing protein n=1 Tax=Caulobacter segnis TaxID=88688 RepID=A0A2W5XGN6_9CAUL|nr:DUF1345 domain-containing protein [Caulobacter segnis]PZR36991.1 MAG: DUF1345 domain-containing protein [Caulobacter segnis]
MTRNPKKTLSGALSHWRLAVAFVAGLITWVVTKFIGGPDGAGLLLAWDVAALVYLATMWTLFIRSDERELRSRAARYDEGVPVLMLIVLVATAASLGAVVDAMLAAKHLSSDAKGVIIGSAVATLVLSWLVLQTVFVLHYAHRHFGAGEDKGGIQFPGEQPSSYLDFAYLAFSVGATFQVSDNSILTSRLRRLVTAHAAAAYFYNTAVLALGINIIASLIGG